MPRALLAVQDMTDIVDFAIELDRRGWQLVASAPTAMVLSEGGVVVTDVVELTGTEVDFNLRLDVLHPQILAAVTADPTQPAHMAHLEDYGIQRFDMVVCDASLFGRVMEGYEPGTEWRFDLAGHALTLAAAANWRYVTLVTHYQDYPGVLHHLGLNGNLPEATRAQLARDATEASVGAATRFSHWLQAVTA